MILAEGPLVMLPVVCALAAAQKYITKAKNAMQHCPLDELKGYYL